MSTESPLVVLPGETIDPSLIPTHKKNPLRLGPGLRHIPPSEIVPTVAGQLVVDHRKTSMWIEYNGGRVRFHHHLHHIHVFFPLPLILLPHSSLLLPPFLYFPFQPLKLT